MSSDLISILESVMSYITGDYIGIAILVVVVIGLVKKLWKLATSLIFVWIAWTILSNISI